MNSTRMTTPNRMAGILLAALALAGAARAQEELGAMVAPKFHDVELWRGTPRSDVGEAGARADSREYLFAPDEAGGLAGALAVEPPPVSREALEGTSEALNPYHALPGGIVLGLAARARGTLEQELVGAHVERGEGGALVLHLADGRALRCPEIAPEVLGACLAFTGQGRDALVDLTHEFGAKPRLAPAFAGGALADLLVRMDGVPHRVHPETRAHKSLIVDRRVSFEARGDELVLDAELEVRLYDDAGSGWAHRASTLAAVGAGFVGPRRADDLSNELAPLAEIAAWLGFLRRIEELDPAGVAALRASLTR